MVSPVVPRDQPGLDVELDLADIQGLILRGYTMAALRLFVLRIEEARPARRFVGALATPTADLLPGLASAMPWFTKPPYCINVGFTFAGLRALELTEESLQSFPEDFRQGALARAEVVGDTGESHPDQWMEPFSPPLADQAHVVLILFAEDEAMVAEVSERLRALLPHGGLTELSHHDAKALPGHVAHFGYRDGFSQPTIAGAPPTHLPDPLPVVPPGAFLFGYPSQHPGLTYPVPAPEELGRNGSFAALRIIEQDVHGFETFLHDAGNQLGIDPEEVAAKLCGRWRNGVPLVVSPHTASPDPPVAEEAMNNFDYVTGDGRHHGVDDPAGRRCPIGSHIRRTNPRSARVAGGNGHRRRIVRRGLPYGPPYDPEHPNDGIPRGLLGLFIGVSLADQFEFIMSEWVNDGVFAPGLGRTKDPLIGGSGSGEQRFEIPVEGGRPRVISGFSSFVTTRGAAYCFLPSFTALRWIGGR